MSVRFCLELPRQHEPYDPCEWPTFLTMRMWLARPRVAVRYSDPPRGAGSGASFSQARMRCPVPRRWCAGRSGHTVVPPEVRVSGKFSVFRKGAQGSDAYTIGVGKDADAEHTNGQGDW